MDGKDVSKVVDSLVVGNANKVDLESTCDTSKIHRRLESSNGGGVNVSEGVVTAEGGACINHTGGNQLGLVRDLLKGVGGLLNAPPDAFKFLLGELSDLESPLWSPELSKAKGELQLRLTSNGLGLSESPNKGCKEHHQLFLSRSPGWWLAFPPLVERLELA